MSYTNPNGQPQGIPAYFTNRIRELIIAEIVAINGYAEHIANSDMHNVNEVWQNIIKDEKKHYGLFLNLLRKYDPEQYQEYVKHTQSTIKSSPPQEYKPDYEKQIILNNIREDLKGEYEAVVLYEQLIIEMPFQDIRDTLVYVITEEKGHAEHLTKLLITLDQDQYDGLS
jgi:rubrerythrin